LSVLSIAGTLLLLLSTALFYRGKQIIFKLANFLWENKTLVLKISLLFVLMWVLLGLSIFVLFIGHGNVSIFFVIQLFALSFALGFLAFFAPAGIGVRDGIFTVGLAGMVEPHAAILLTVGHRIIYIFAEIICAACAWMNNRPK
jgi:uncharacterized membrane protein YbhN (UPF0104 family)